MTYNPDEHKVPTELDAAYARNVDERFDGLTHPEGHDGVPAVIDAWAVPEGYGGVDLTISETNIRLNLTPQAADALGRILIREAARAELGQAWQQASRLEALFASGHQAVTEAEIAAQGLRPVTIAHGTPENAAEEALIHELPGLAAECGTVAGARGGGEHVTYMFTGADADTAAAAFADRIRAAAPQWWRVTPTAYPSWHVDL